MIQLEQFSPAISAVVERPEELAAELSTNLPGLPAGLVSLLVEKSAGLLDFKTPARFPGMPGSKYSPGGWLSLWRLYGLGGGPESILAVAKRFEGRLPPQITPFAPEDGGNQLCLDRDSGAVLLWLHDEPYPEDSVASFERLADSFDSWLVSLEVDPDDRLTESKGVVSFEFDF